MLTLNIETRIANVLAGSSPWFVVLQICYGTNIYADFNLVAQAQIHRLTHLN